MKLFIPIGSFYPAQLGGINNSMYWIAKKMVANGIDVTIIATDTGITEEHKITLDKWMNLDGIKVIYCKTWIHKLPFTMMFRSFIQLFKSDIVHLNSLFYIPSLVMATFCSLLGKKVIWSPRGELLVGALQYSSGPKKIALKFIRFIAGRNFTFHGTSPDENKAILEVFEKEPKNIENYMELPTKVNAVKINQLLFLGRIHPVKALKKLIEGVSLSKEFKNQNYTLKIVGFEDKAGYVKELKELVSSLNLNEKIIFSEPLSGELKLEEYAKSKFKLLVSESENFGNVIIEALTQATPVIASKGTPWKQLDTKNAGYWINNSPESIGKTIDEALALDKSKYNVMAQNAENLVRSQYDIELNYHHWVNLYKS